MLSIQIQTDNAAFEGDDNGTELARILRKLAVVLEDMGTGPDSGQLYDINGNRVGDWKVSA
jgi:hypothetical protein